MKILAGAVCFLILLAIVLLVRVFIIILLEALSSIPFGGLDEVTETQVHRHDDLRGPICKRNTTTSNPE